MYEVIATESYIWIVTELCSGGELFDYLVEKGRLSEEETRLIFGQLCLAVAYLHGRGIVHRDLKLENVLLDERCRVKLGDFGFTREYEKGSFMETFCGTTGYASPEMLEGKKYQGPEVDVWSLGIILYCLLTGTLPFDDDDEGVMRQMIIEADFEDPDWLSIESRNLIKGILQKDVSARLTIPQILSHDWFKTRKLTYEIDSQQPDKTSLPSPLPLRQNSSTFTKTPPIHPIRTPARTKRRSISSNLSDPSSPIAEKTPSPLPIHDVDFVSLLTTPAPIIFSTPVERELLNTLSMLGFDTAQIVHSVLSDACDATGALWWMLKKAERRQMEEEPKVSKKRWVSTGVQTDTVATLNLARSAPQLAFVPPTPTFPRSVTPPRPTTPTRSLLVSPLDSSSKSHPSTPASSLRDKESKSRKVRSGSVSIMQRATTALEAAGLVRKKSSEVVREEKERERSKEMERKMVSGEESRSSHGSSGSSKLTKSPPLKPEKDHLPSTPPPSIHRQLPQIGSPWVFADANEGPSYSRSIPQTPANTPGDGFPQSLSTPNFSESSNSKISSAPQRNRANILKAFRLWFHEDKKGKRKETTGNGNSHIGYTRPHSTPTQPFSVGGSKRRGSIGGGFNGFGHRQRPSASSRRSSSVNSRRSSGTSVQMAVMDSPQIPNRLSFGSHTPNSERGDYPSRPSSNRLRTASPMRRYHRRMGSGSSTTRVVRQSSARPTHVRSNSATSSLYSPSSSRPASFYELSENEGYRSASPYKPRSRRSSDEHRRPSSSSTFIAQKRQGPFMSPGRSSWKKAWGLEPPGWQSRTAHLPVEVIAISPASEPASIRDVFSGRQSSSPGDEDEWVDEEDDVPFAGGLGQMGMVSMSTSSSTVHTDTTPPMMMLSPPSRGHWPTKLTTNTQHSRSSSSGSGSAVAARQKAGHSPVERASALPQDNLYETETRGGRRQLPASRSGPAFRQPIQEEDEDEEE
ncbi:Serine/threonine-protein kinase MARK2 [Termitomyces sp. J132]|nr:Serine/threonine-protein kinase MARK2 [Termitomyces sp. J132]